jgi:hypothetical protein
MAMKKKVTAKAKKPAVKKSNKKRVTKEVALFTSEAPIKPIEERLFRTLQTCQLGHEALVNKFISSGKRQDRDNVISNRAKVDVLMDLRDPDRHNVWKKELERKNDPNYKYRDAQEKLNQALKNVQELKGKLIRYLNNISEDTHYSERKAITTLLEAIEIIYNKEK